MKKLWGGRFEKSVDVWVDEFSASIEFDQKLVQEDITGSIAHVTMLASCGIVTDAESKQIIAGLESILADAQEGKLTFSVSQEDIHLNVESMLHERIGPVAGKLHTGRSRNDQVATDMHLYLKNQVNAQIELLENLQTTLVNVAEQHVETLIPGYTHLQRAQPISFAHHLMAYVSMFGRDVERLQDSLKRIDLNPLGAGALAGTTFPIDRMQTTTLLGFAAPYSNSLDAVSDRDFIIEYLSNASLVMMHLSRLSEELIIWSTTEFAFVEMDDTFSTGSSIMPQKKNPDMAELIRGKVGRVYGNLFGLLTVLKGLPLAYNKDMQEDKEGMFDTVETLNGCISIMNGMIATMRVNVERMESSFDNDYSNATELADWLAANGMPFREAHEIVGRAVLYAIGEGKPLGKLTLEQFHSFHPSITADVYRVLNPYNAVARRNSLGGTGFDQVRAQIAAFKDK
ncbi:MAG: argininosuccinate lyase [Bacilli bacterium]